MTVFIDCNWVSTRWQWSVDLCKNREETAIHRSRNNTQHKTKAQGTKQNNTQNNTKKQNTQNSKQNTKQYTKQYKNTKYTK